MLALSGEESDLADGGFDRKETLIANIGAEKKRHGAKPAGMEVPKIERSIE